MLTQAIYWLAAEPSLANHPIREYLHNPQLKATIAFNYGKSGNGAMAYDNTIFFRHDQDLGYYIRFLAHEFIHVASAAKYGGNYSFFSSEDYAIAILMDEAFAYTIDYWAYQKHPDIPKNRQIRNSLENMSVRNRFDVIRNDYQADNPRLTEAQLDAQAAVIVFENFSTSIDSNIILTRIPNSLKNIYGTRNTFLIPEYEAYRARADALLRHKWNYLFSLMPQEVQQALRANNETYDRFRARTKRTFTLAASHAKSPEDSILYWVNYDYEGAARQRLNNQSSSDRTYNYLSEEYERRLNAVMREIDPFFTPVDTTRSFQRVWQEQYRGRDQQAEAERQRQEDERRRQAEAERQRQAEAERQRQQRQAEAERQRQQQRADNIQQGVRILGGILQELLQ